MSSHPGRTRRTYLRLAGVSLALAAAIPTLGELLTSAQTPPQLSGALRFPPQQLAECVEAGQARSAVHAGTGAIRFVGTEAGRAIPHPRPQPGASPETAAREYMAACGTLFGIADAADELTVSRSAAIGARRSVVRLQQRVQGIPVMGGELVVHLDSGNNILAVAGETLPAPAVSTVPSIDGPAAADAALDAVASSYGLDRQVLSTTTPELWVYSPSLIGAPMGRTALVWRMAVVHEAMPPVRELVLIDAQQGSVALHFNQIHTARNRNTYTASNLNTLPGTLVCNEANPTCAGGDADAVAAHVYAGNTYDYFFANFGRDSLNNAGMALTSTVHFGPVGYQNAFWNGQQMAYGDNFSKADDVVGHELAHGVTQFTSNLFYYYQSGAINESLSDVFGEFIDQTNGSADDATTRWQLGEGIFPGGGMIRNMQNPPALGDPDRIRSPLYYTGANDNGGVHFNSGVNNKAAYLIVDGGTFNGQTVAPLGVVKAGQIYYEVEAHLLTSGSDYADLYDALYQACTNLIGTAGIVAADCQQVRNASIAVEMHLEPVPGFNPDAPICGPGQAPLNVFSDSLEAGMGNFSTIAPIGGNRWSTVTGYAHTGRYSLYGDDFLAGPGDSSVATANGITLPAGAFLHFSHAFGFQTPDRDGGVIEYSTNNGATWTDAGGLIDSNGYRGLIAGGFGNPLAGRAAFIGTSHGYTSTRLNLGTLAGQSVRFRWRLAIDTNTYDLGWVVDDVRIYRCSGAQIVTLSPNSGPQGRPSLDVTVTGQETHFAPGVTTADFGPGITVNGVTVTDATHAVANITIAPNAALGGRDVSLTTGGELAIGLSLFSVTVGPQLAISPNRGQPAQQNLTVAITGSLTHFVQGQTVANFGAGITTINTTVADARHATALITIAGDAPLGPRNVTMTTGSEVATSVGGFLVRVLPADATTYAYVVGRRTGAGNVGPQTLNTISTATNAIVASVDVGRGCYCVGPDGVAVNPEGTRVYVTNEMDNSLSVVDTQSNSVIATIAVGTGPTSVTVHPDGTRVYVVNGSGATSVTVLDASSHATLATIPLGSPVVQARGVTISPDGSRLYVSGYGSGLVRVINTATNTIVGTISTVNPNVGLDVSPNGSRLYVATYAFNNSPNPAWVTVADTATNGVIANIVMPSQFPADVAVKREGNRAYVITGSGAPILDLATNSIVGSVPPPAAGSSVEFTPDGTRAYVATYFHVGVVNAATDSILGQITFNETIHGRAGSIAMGPGPIRTLSLGGSLSFGYRMVDSTSQGSLIVSNAGNAPLTVNSIGYPAGFSGNWNSGVIPAGGSQMVTVSFTPTAVSSYGGAITINGNQTAGPNTITVTGAGMAVPLAAADFDDDGKTDIGIYRRTTGLWAILQSGGGSKNAGWGSPPAQDAPVAADYDGDGKADLAVYRRTTGQWLIFQSQSLSLRAAGWGAPALGDLPVPADYDGDGKADLGVYRQSTGQWFISRSSNGALMTATWGAPSLGDVPVPADYDGDGKADIGVYRLSTGQWFINRSTNGALMQMSWGGPTLGDTPVPGDYDGDGKADVAVYRLSTGGWFVSRSTNGGLLSGIWGAPTLGDAPVPGDYDGDGRIDFGVYRTTTGQWFIQRSSNGSLLSPSWGAPGLGDAPTMYR